jgi:hypothetical protein
MGELQVRFGERYEILIKLKTAKARGVTVPPTLLARANEMIEGGGSAARGLRAAVKRIGFVSNSVPKRR